MPEQLLKLSPNRGVYLKGVDAYGAFASITGASSTGFTLNTVFRDAGDFAVVVLADSENGSFEHQLMRPLPDFNYTGLTLSFDWSTSGVFPIDSRYFPTVNQNRLGVITHPTSGAEQNIVCSLWENATLKTGSFTAATASFTVTHDPNINDVITLFIGNVAFGYTGTGFDTASTVASSLTVAINTYDWSSFAEASIAVLATWNGSSGVTLTFARTGKVTVAGAIVVWADNGGLPSELFVGLVAGDPFVIAGVTYTILTVVNAQELWLTSTPSGLTSGTKYTYMAPMGGEDGNGLTAYIVASPSNSGITLSTSTLSFTGGVSDGLVWTISLNFSTLTGVLPANVANPLDPSVTQYAAGNLRQIFLTVGPKINPSVTYADTEGSVTISNWTVTGTNRNLYVAGPVSVRIGSRDSWCTYTGSWSEDAAIVHYQGFARVSSTSGNSISVKYACGTTHDLYIGTEFYTDRQIVNISLDGDTATAFDTYQSSQSWGRRKIRSSVASGQHVLTITLTGTHNSAAVADGSGHYSFLFDFLEAAVPSEVQDSAVTYSTVTAALDYDTYPYQMTPTRLVWQLQTLGFLGKTNLDLGVFWLYNRVRVGGTFDTATITFSGSWSYGDSATVNISGFAIGKSIVSGDTPTTIALHFAYYINSASVGFWASASAGVLTITQRSTGSEFAATITASKTSSGGGVSPSSQSVGDGTEGVWTINDSAALLLNAPIRAWLADFYATLEAASMQNVSAVTFEVVNPPAGYAAQFADGTNVTTATGLGTLNSNQCAVGASKVIALQKETFAEVASLQNAAGLTVNIQCGEWGVWYFPEKQAVPIGNVANTYPAVIGLAVAHGMSSGQNCVIAGVFDGSGNVSAVNGTWPVAVVDTTHFSVPVAGGSWTSGTGVVSYGGCAVYDSETASAASTALGRPLASFYTQDDDPSANPSDIAFLQARLMGHFSAALSPIRASYPSAIFELLLPLDVNNPTVYWNASWPYAQGGRWNYAVNVPAALWAKSGSGFDKLLIEGLSWSANYHDLNRAKAAMAWPVSGGRSWTFADIAYLVANFSGACCFAAEYLAALNYGYLQLRIWAADQTLTMGTPFPMPVNQSTANS